MLIILFKLKVGTQYFKHNYVTYFTLLIILYNILNLLNIIKSLHEELYLKIQNNGLIMKLYI